VSRSLGEWRRIVSAESYIVNAVVRQAHGSSPNIALCDIHPCSPVARVLRTACIRRCTWGVHRMVTGNRIGVGTWIGDQLYRRRGKGRFLVKSYRMVRRWPAWSCSEVLIMERTCSQRRRFEPPFFHTARTGQTDCSTGDQKRRSSHGEDTPIALAVPKLCSNETLVFQLL